ncbi:VCBS repeat-containing protein [Candidatus Obscuribacterales bacterium]|nr:VCBS repeat-containing protein [Candidatus Obscuribacterales bacterium]MBX3151453.1 VCBS repeat-containing protein [Candidatus Obscuribacterales bacterium]
MSGAEVCPQDRLHVKQPVLALVFALSLALTLGRSSEQTTTVNVKPIAEAQLTVETSSEPVARPAEESWEDRELNLSQKVYRQASVLVEPHPVQRGIDSVAIYRGKNLILRKSLRSDFTDGDFMWLSFPYAKKPAKSVHSFDGDLNDYIADGMKSASTPFADFNGDGSSEIILTYNYGNASDIYKIYSLRGTTKELGTIEAVRCTARFMDVDQDGRYEVLVRDPRFFGWKTCNACSPMPLVVLKLEEKKFKLATKLMKTQRPSKERQRKMLSDWGKACTNEQADLLQTGLVEKYDNTTFRLAPSV